jgi:multiple sugar transport system ATP-binding protein
MGHGGEVIAVNDMNIDIADQEFLVLVGPSGCGKTTALRLLAGLEEISDGKILIGERIVNDVAPKDRDIAMVFQSYALYPHLSVYDNMAFGLKLRKLPKEEIKRRVNEAAEILGIQDLLDRKPRQLSGGQGLPVRRTPIESGRQAQGGHARRDQQAAPKTANHLHLRDP